MAQTGYTPISLYYSTTASAAPTAGNLVAGELAINTVDEKLYFKNSAGTVKLLASSAGSLGDVVGPASATDKAIATFDGTTGKLIQNNSGVTITSGVITATGFSGPLNGTVGATTPNTGAFTTLSSTGNTTLGDASTDTVTVNGYMGVGGAGNSSYGVQVISTALTGTGQAGVSSSPTITSAATTSGYAYYAKVSTAAASFTVSDIFGVRVIDATKGAGSTITNQHGLYINDQTQGTNNYGIVSLVSSGTNKYNIYASGTAENYFAGNVGIGSQAGSTTGQLRIAGNGSGATTFNGISLETSIQSGVTSAWRGLLIRPTTQATAFTLSSLYGVYINPQTFGAGSTVTNQYGVHVESTLTGATNNYGFYSNIASGSNRYNFYANGTADNYFAGNVGIGSTSLTQYNLRISKTITGNADSYGVLSNGLVQPDVTSSATYYSANIRLAASAFTTNTVYGFYVGQSALSGGAAITNQSGFFAGSGLTGATNNYGFRSDIDSGTGRWNFYASGTADNYFAGNVGIGTSSPAYKLDVVGGQRINAASGGYIDLSYNGTVAGNLVAGNGVFYVNTQTTNTVINPNGGNLGLGVTPSAWGSSYRSMDVGSIASFFSDSNVTANVSANQYIDAGGRKYKTTNFATMYQQYNGQHQWYTAPSGTAGNPITFTQAMTLFASGALWVGSSSEITGGQGYLGLNGASGSGAGSSVGFAQNGTFLGGIGQLSRILGSGTSQDIFIQAQGTSNNLGLNSVNGYLYFQTGSTERMRIDSSGNVGIGTSSPGYKLDVNGAGNFSDGVKIGTNSTAATGKIFNNGTWGMGFVAASASTNAMGWFDSGVNTLMTLDASGNLGVGTTSPNKWPINKTITVNAASGNYGGFELAVADTLTAAFIGTTTETRIAARGGSNPITFELNGSERMRIDSSGNVGIGTASPSAKLHVFGGTNATIQPSSAIAKIDSSGGNGLYFGNIGASTYASYIQSAYLSDSPDVTYPLLLNPDGGNVGIGTTSPGSKLDVKGTLRLSGSTSGYVGLAPAAAAGSTTYTLPSADGTSGQVLSTNGSGTLSWSSGSSGQLQYALYTSGTATWTCPSGVTRIKVICIGGGGGGGAFDPGGPQSGGSGGKGGIAVGIYTVTPGTGYTATVGAGGAGSNSTSGSAGGSSSLGALLSATGGGGGQNGVIGGADGADGAGASGITANSSVFYGAGGDFVGANTRGNATSATAAVTWTASLNRVPGANGQGGTNATNSTGGTGGVVYIQYVG